VELVPDFQLQWEPTFKGKEGRVQRGGVLLVRGTEDRTDGKGGNGIPVNSVVSCHREQKCADTIGTVLVPWAGHFQRKNNNVFFPYKIYVYGSNFIKQHSETVTV